MKHDWRHETLAQLWECDKCKAVCDHDTPCGKHGDCLGVPPATDDIYGNIGCLAILLALALVIATPAIVKIIEVIRG